MTDEEIYVQVRSGDMRESEFLDWATRVSHSCYEVGYADGYGEARDAGYEHGYCEGYSSGVQQCQ